MSTPRQSASCDFANTLIADLGVINRIEATLSFSPRRTPVCRTRSDFSRLARFLADLKN